MTGEVYECPGIRAPQPPNAPSEGYVACYRAGHECPPKVALTVDDGDYRLVTYRCPCCGDYGVTYGGPVDWFTPPDEGCDCREYAEWGYCACMAKARLNGGSTPSADRQPTPTAPEVPDAGR